MTVLCAFGPPVWYDVGNTGDINDKIRQWAMRKMIEMDYLSEGELERKAFEFWQHLIEDSHLQRDVLWVRVDRAFLQYFHSKKQLLFKKDVNIVKKSHQNKYSLSIKTKFGNIEHHFSSIRECKDTTGLELRNHLRKILYP